MLDDPQPFTDTQRELFGTSGIVTRLNRVKSDDFAEADQWIDVKPITAVEKLRQYREEIRQEARERRQQKDRTWLLAPYPDIGAKWLLWDWKPMGVGERQELMNVLHGWRRNRAGSIRLKRADLNSEVCTEIRYGPPGAYQLVDALADSLIRAEDSLAFDAMKPALKAIWARRALRLVWVLTDTDDLKATKLRWLREWPWGDHPYEFIENIPDGCERPIPRLFARVEIFDRCAEQWEALTRAALRALEEAEPGATVVPEHADMVAPANEGGAKETAPDGPQAPKSFCWRGTVVEIEPKPWALLNYLWNRRKAKVKDVEQAVWGDEAETDGRLKAAMNKAGDALLESGSGMNLSKSGQWLTLG